MQQYSKDSKGRGGGEGREERGGGGHALMGGSGWKPPSKPYDPDVSAKSSNKRFFKLNGLEAGSSKTIFLASPHAANAHTPAGYSNASQNIILEAGMHA
jgi:hypothetical protein